MDHVLRHRIQRVAELRAQIAEQNAEALAIYQPLPKVEEWHKSKAQWRILDGGNRSGKTTAGAVEVAWWFTHSHPYFSTPRPCNILCVENTWTLVGNPMWEKMSLPNGLKMGPETPPIIPGRCIDSISFENAGMNIPKRVTSIFGDRIDFRSADSGRTKFEGSEWDLVWIDEEMPDPLIFDEVQRGLVDRGGRGIWTFTPLARSLKALQLHEDAADPDGGMDVFESQISILDNPHLNVKARDAFIASIPEEYYDTRVYGEFLILEGLVYGEWSKKLHEIGRSQFLEYDQGHPRVIIIDPGYADPCAVLWAMLLPGEPRRVILYREFYRRRQTVKEVVKHIAMASSNDPLVKAIIDPSSLKKGQDGHDCLFDQYAKAFRDHGVMNAMTGRPLQLTLAVNSIESGYYRVKEMLVPDEEGIPGIRAVEDLVSFKKELGRHRWGDETEKRDIPKKPIDRDNHLLDGLRYLCADLPPYSRPENASMSRSARLVEWYQEQQRVDRGGDSITIGG